MSRSIVLDDFGHQGSAWHALTRFLRGPIDAASCALLPASCSLCKAPLLLLSAAPVCQDCWATLRPQSADLCARCGEDLGIAEFSPSGAIRDQLCRPCELVPPDFDKAVAFGVYEGLLRGLIHLLKYDRIESVAQGLSELLAPYVVAMLRDAASEVLVVPVPLHPGKRRDRGFNQAELLARGVIASVRKVAPAIELTLAAGMLSRKRATESQSTLTTRQRRRNLRGAFFVSEQGGLDGREVLLIDDIYTTGATARACGKALRDAGAARVWVATVGRAQRDGAVRWDAAGFGVPTGFAAA